MSSDTPAFTEHTEPREQGEKDYIRYEGRGRELLTSLAAARN